jgi:hypothetical protein
MLVRVTVATAWRVLGLWRIAANILNKQSRTADKGVVLQLGGWARA